MSRQYDWQLRKLAEGKCRQCGKRKLVTTLRCDPCRKIYNAYMKTYFRNRKNNVDKAQEAC